jgi:hypothetical protein
MPISKLTHSGDHDQMAPRNRRTGDLIPGVSPEMAAEYEANTRTLLPEGVAGPMLPEEAGYHDAIVRMAHTGEDDKYYSDNRTYVGAGKNWVNRNRDAAVSGNGMGFVSAIQQSGDPRLGGASTRHGEGRMGSSVIQQDFDAARLYEKGVRTAQIDDLDSRLPK